MLYITKSYIGFSVMGSRFKETGFSINPEPLNPQLIQLTARETFLNNIKGTAGDKTAGGWQ
jgi:hypothetical protein